MSCAPDTWERPTDRSRPRPETSPRLPSCVFSGTLVVVASIRARSVSLRRRFHRAASSSRARALRQNSRSFALVLASPAHRAPKIPSPTPSWSHRSSAETPWRLRARWNAACPARGDVSYERALPRDARVRSIRLARAERIRGVVFAARIRGVVFERVGVGVDARDDRNHIRTTAACARTIGDVDGARDGRCARARARCVDANVRRRRGARDVVVDARGGDGRGI